MPPYPTGNAQTVNNLKQGTSETFAIMWIIESSEAEKGTLNLPHTQLRFLNPMASDGEVAVCVRCLPGITGQANLTCHSQTLSKSVSNATELIGVFDIH